MKKLYILAIVIISTVFAASAQKAADDSREAKWKELEEFKMKFIAQEIELKDNQQKAFFELYSQMSEERRNIMKELRPFEKKAKASGATEADFEAVAKARTQAREKDALLEKKYDEKFSAVLTGKQIYKLKEAEEKFRQKMHDMRKKKRAHKQK